MGSNRNGVRGVVRAYAIHAGVLRAAPARAMPPCVSATNNVKIKAKWPSSGNMIGMDSLLRCFYWPHLKHAVLQVAYSSHRVWRVLPELETSHQISACLEQPRL